MNLIYMCVFYQESYIRLLKLLMTSISEKGYINKHTTDILIITSAAFQPIIQETLGGIDLPIRYHILNLHTMMEASCCKLNIFQYNEIDKYQKILYLDVDVLVNSNINVLFDTEIHPEKLHALEEGTIGDWHWGKEFFDFTNTQFNAAITGFSAGVFYFMNNESIKTLFQATNEHIAKYLSAGGKIPTCLDQPFLVYNSVVQDKCDNQFMKNYLENNPSTVSNEKIIYHFPGGPGSYGDKLHKMNAFWKIIQSNIVDINFETRNEMLQYYCNKLTNPKLLEIGVFKGDFLDYLVKHCKTGSIDAVDLFEGVTCSGDSDGNNVVHYDVGKSYTELLTKYTGMSHIQLYKSDSVTFLQSREDNTYDIIYIDGDHSYSGVKNDLINAFSKIKNGGYIMGHDYEMNMKKTRNNYDFGVKEAVDEFCITYKQTILSKAFDGCVSYCICINK